MKLRSDCRSRGLKPGGLDSHYRRVQRTRWHIHSARKKVATNRASPRGLEIDDATKPEDKPCLHFQPSGPRHKRVEESTAMAAPGRALLSLERARDANGYLPAIDAPVNGPGSTLLQ